MCRRSSEQRINELRKCVKPREKCNSRACARARKSSCFLPHAVMYCYARDTGCLFKRWYIAGKRKLPGSANFSLQSALIYKQVSENSVHVKLALLRVRFMTRSRQIHVMTRHASFIDRSARNLRRSHGNERSRRVKVATSLVS